MKAMLKLVPMAVFVLAGVVPAAFAAEKNPQAVPVAGFTCPMHPDVISSDPGKCPQCGMDMVPAKKAKRSKRKKGVSYDCPQCVSENSVKPGACPHCGVPLIEFDANKKKKK